MGDDLEALRLWRVGYHLDPIGFAPREGYAWSHRFDDLEGRWRTVYCAFLPETALREVLADLRPNTAAIARFLSMYGEDARDELPAAPITPGWRRRSVLAPLVIRREQGCGVLDLTDATVCHELERQHAQLLADHGMAHLDLHEITTRRREVTRRIATDAYDDGYGVIRYPSSIDPTMAPCYAVIEGRAHLELEDEPLSLADPAPEALENVAAGWGLALTPTSPPYRAATRTGRRRSS